MTSTTIATQRIVKARRAMMNAQNPEFKDYWRKVVEALTKAVDHGN